MDAKTTKVVVGSVARFFHPRTLGVMHRGRVTRVHDDGTVSVRFDVDGKVWRTTPDFIAMEGRLSRSTWAR